MKHFKTIFTIFAGIVLTASVAAAADWNAGLTQSSGIRDGAGFFNVDGSATKLDTSVEHGAWDGLLIVMLNNGSDEINEIDLGIGYSHDLTENLGLRVGLEYWDYTEIGGNNLNAVANLDYSGLPVDLGLGIVQQLNENGTWIYITARKTFDIADINGHVITLTPGAKLSALHNYWGITSLLSNVVYSLEGGVEKGDWALNPFVEYHDGNESLGDAFIVGTKISYSF